MKIHIIKGGGEIIDALCTISEITAESLLRLNHNGYFKVSWGKGGDYIKYYKDEYSHFVVEVKGGKVRCLGEVNVVVFFDGDVGIMKEVEKILQNDWDSGVRYTSLDGKHFFSVPVERGAIFLESTEKDLEKVVRQLFGFFGFLEIIVPLKKKRFKLC